MHFTMEYPLNASTLVILVGVVKGDKDNSCIVDSFVDSFGEVKGRDIIFDKNHLSLSPLSPLSSLSSLSSLYSRS